MSKVTKAYSIDVDTFNLLENYCSASDNWDRKISRSKVVNDAIRWFITGDTAELVHNNERLLEAVKRANVAIMESKPSNQRWWRRLLLGR